MKINIRGEKQEITKAMKEYAEEKLEKLSKYLEKSNEVNGYVLFKIRGPKQKVEVTIPLTRLTLRVEEEAKDFYAAIDTAIDKLERQIRKNKTKLQSKKMKEFKEITFEEVFVDEKQDNSKIVRRKSVDIKPISEEEAIIELELLGHDFFMFKNDDTNNISVIYKRKEGNYGIIESK